jgi:hypothetical protein
MYGTYIATLLGLALINRVTNSSSDHIYGDILRSKKVLGMFYLSSTR